ncbi:hypothetical protein P4493_05030 [Bacillus thuringiensis]|uniref:hypothetical protein n=1 Tax=Bacillus TaxID=1386 RepID=UPI000AEA1360|nr:MULTISPECIES: hypothetical protein [Bacillus]MEC2535611.1 hypothetical protein [Bacillus cereus]MED1153642.1 hypothetical protein [Bacillus paranthracis]MCC4011941.1 hypothetical protein [Bacillus thuringiensis]MCC4028004.1 hypothetical protein [Bacillus thuringiensis]MCR6819440.1 hypothetical protein [Bacillus thuringiensis]
MNSYGCITLGIFTLVCLSILRRAYKERRFSFVELLILGLSTYILVFGLYKM